MARVSRFSQSIILTLLLLLLWPIRSSGQNVPGVQMFSTNEYGVDIATGNVNSIDPLRSKIGKIPFWSQIVGTSGLTVVNSGTQWATMLVGHPGWTYQDPTTTYFEWSVVFGPQKCVGNDGKTYYTYLLGDLGAIDSTGASHSFTGNPRVFVGSGPSGSGCDTGQGTSGGPYAALDGSGYNLILTNSNPTVYFKNGSYTQGSCTAPNIGSGCVLSHTLTDQDGASIQGAYNNSGPITDTLGTTVGTLIGNPGLLTGVSYLDALSGTQKYTLGYTTLPIASNFNCLNTSGAQQPADYSYSQVSMLTSITVPGSGQYSFTYETTYKKSGYYTGRIATITLPSGGTISYTYSGGNQGINCPYHTVPTLVVKVTDNNGHTDTYKYVSSLSTAATIDNNAPLGNFTVVKTDPGLNQTVYSFAGELQTQAAYYQGGCPTSIAGCAGGGTELKAVMTCYNGNFTNCVAPSSVPTLPIKRKDAYTWVGMSSQSLVETTYDCNVVSACHGLVTAVKQYDFGVALPPNPPSGTPLTETDTTYANVNGATCGSISTNILDHPCTITTYNSGSIVSQTEYTYNAGGHPTQTKTLKSGSTYLTSSATYDSNTGMITSFTDVNNAITNYYYNGTGGCSNLLLTSTVLPVNSLTTSQKWDCNGGVLTSSTDENNQPTGYGYVDQNNHADPLWRRLSVTDPLGNVTWTKYSPGGTLPVTMETLLNFPSSNPTSTVDTLTTFDGLARPITSQKRTAPGAGTFDNTVTYGYSWTSTGPVPGPVNTQTFPGGTTPTTSQFDALVRNASVTDANSGSLSTTYPLQDVYRTLGPPPTSENAKSRQLEYDGAGRPTSVCEVLSQGGSSCGQKSSASGYLTSYAYSVPAQGQSQVQVTQGAQQRTYLYDGLGRLISETNPESSGVPPTIATKYGYDSDSACNLSALGVLGTSNGDLVSVLDANGNKTCYNYDSLHRVTDIVVLKNGACYPPVKRFRYDSSSNAILNVPTGYAASNISGRMFEAWTGDCVWPTPKSGYPDTAADQWFAYWPLGQITDLWQSTPHICCYYHGVVSYAANGVVTSIGGVPGYTTISYGLDGEGRPNSATQGAVTLVSGVQYTAGSQPHIVTFGSGDTDTYLYDSNTGRMTNYTFTVGSKSIAAGLTWNANGTLQQLAITRDDLNSGGVQTCNYLYDDLGRVGTPPGSSANSVDCGSHWQQKFTYDQYGNIQKSGSSSWMPGYDATTNHALSPITYDNNGNLTSDTINTYAYYVDNKLASTNSTTCNIFGNSDGTCVLYDGFGREVERGVGTSYTEVMYTPVGKTAIMSGQTNTLSAYFPLPGGGTYFQSSSTDGTGYFWHKDWLGSVRLASSIQNGTCFYDRAFAPFGEMYNDFCDNSTVGFNFTGDTRDSFPAAGLFDTPNRELNPVQGRWMSPDPAGIQAADMTNPQSWNRYAYVLNNPLSFIDPTGLDCVYLNDAGDDVESIDHDSNADECAGNGNGGYWVPGTVANSSWVTDIDQNNGTIGAYSNQNGFLGWTASANNDTGVAWQTVGVNVPNTSVVVNVSTSVDDLSPSAQRTILAIAAAAPRVCGGGVFAYGGRSLDLGPANAFAGGIIEADSVSGISKGALFEGGGGEGMTGGGGVIVANEGGGLLGSENLAYGGAGVGIPGAHVGGGVLGFSGGIGGYAEISAGGREVGGGAYLNITNNAGCKQR